MYPFPTSEYQQRIDNTRASMSERGIDVLLSTNPANMAYLTGYDGWSFYVHQLIVLSQDADQPLWIGRGMDANAAKVTTYLDHDNVFGYPDDYVQSETKHPMNYVADLLKGKGWDRGTIGVEMDTYYFTAACYQTLLRDLPNASLVDAGTLVNWVRVIKSANELAYMRQAARANVMRLRPYTRAWSAAHRSSAVIIRAFAPCFPPASALPHPTSHGMTSHSKPVRRRFSSWPVCGGAITAPWREPCTWASRRNA
jgi:Xaa-Pro aminopeptidase